MNLEDCRIDPSWVSGISVKKQLTHIPIRRPKPSQWFRVRPGEEWTFDAFLYRPEDDSEQPLLVMQRYQPELLQQNLCQPVRFYMLMIYGSNTLILSEVGLPDGEGKHNSWHESRMQHYEKAKERWIKISANRSLGSYELWLPEGNLAEPEWPDEPASMIKALELAFKDHVIDADDHPVLNRLRGRS